LSALFTAADAMMTRKGVVRNAGLVLVAGYVVGMGLIVLSLRHGLDPYGKPLGADFIIFYSASMLALKGKAVLAYAPSALMAAQRTVAAPTNGRFLWCYPPTFQLLILPLAATSYRAAFALWMVVTGAMYLAMTRLIARGGLALILALAFPGVFMNLSQGQNGFLTAALLGGGLLLLDRRPWLAGALLGLLVCKPHFGLVFPVLLLASGRWRSLLAAAVSAVLFVALATAVFGIEAWRAFFAALPAVSHNFAAGLLPLAKIPTLFATLRLLGVPATAALLVGVLAAAPFVVATVIAWRRPGPLALKAGLAVLTTLLLSPYLFDYDLTLLALPIGVLAAHGQTARQPRNVKVLLVLIFALPMLVEPIADLTHLQVAPLVIMLSFAAIWSALQGVRSEAASASAVAHVEAA
jgi:hypothetical protein